MNSIIIVGASSGIGKCVAQLYIEAGWHVGVAARRSNELNKLKALSPEQVEIMTIDVTADDASSRLSEFIALMGGMDIFFLASGVGHQNIALDPHIEHDTIATNVQGFTVMVDTAFDYFRSSARHGHIAIISSIAGTRGLGVAASYSASKRYQWTYLSALEQLAHIENIDVLFTDIRPGFVRTALLNDGKSYPLLLNAHTVARSIFKAISSHRRIQIIDWRYAVLVAFWQLIPRWLWRNLHIKN